MITLTPFTDDEQRLIDQVPHLLYSRFTITSYAEQPKHLCKQAARAATESHGYATTRNEFNGREITPSAFLGPYYDTPTRLLTLPPTSGTFAKTKTKGYADALSSPPYPLKQSPEEIQTLFNSILHDLLHDLTGSVIYAWDTDRSTYFDDGKEWWGAFLWTIWYPARNEIIVIGASTSD